MNAWKPSASDTPAALPIGRTSPRSALAALEVDTERIYTDHGLTGRTRARPGLDRALAAVRCGDSLVVNKLDRLARSVPDARDIADELWTREVKLALGPSTHDPTDPMGQVFFNILATFAEFESDLIRLRTREGMAVARAKGKLRGKKPKLSERQTCELRRLCDTGEYSVSDLGEVFLVSRPNRLPYSSASTWHRVAIRRTPRSTGPVVALHSHPD